jgi:hypothetical protein
MPPPGNQEIHESFARSLDDARQKFIFDYLRADFNSVDAAAARSRQAH